MAIRCLAYSRDGGGLLAGCSDGTVSMWRTGGGGGGEPGGPSSGVGGGNEAAQPAPPLALPWRRHWVLLGHEGPVSGGALSHDGLLVYTAGADGTVSSL